MILRSNELCDAGHVMSQCGVRTTRSAECVRGAFSEAPRKCGKQIHRKILEERQQRKLLCRVQFGFESFQVADGQAASIHFEHPFRLEAGKIAGDEFAHGANL